MLTFTAESSVCSTSPLQATSILQPTHSTLVNTHTTHLTSLVDGERHAYRLMSAYIQTPYQKRWDILTECYQKMGHLDSKWPTHTHTHNAHIGQTTTTLPKDGTSWQNATKRWDILIANGRHTHTQRECSQETNTNQQDGTDSYQMRNETHWSSAIMLLVVFVVALEVIEGSDSLSLCKTRQFHP